jgi:hypothetical protein
MPDTTGVLMGVLVDDTELSGARLAPGRGWRCRRAPPRRSSRWPTLALRSPSTPPSASASPWWYVRLPSCSLKLRQRTCNVARWPDGGRCALYSFRVLRWASCCCVWRRLPRRPTKRNNPTPLNFYMAKASFRALWSKYISSPFNLPSPPHHIHPATSLSTHQPCRFKHRRAQHRSR